MSNIGKAYANGVSVASQANRDAALTSLRLRLLENGYVPIPVTGPDYEHPEVNSPGKQPFFRDWQQVSRDTLTPNVVEGWTTRIADHPNTGLLTGEMLGLDIDVPIPSTSAQLQRMAVALLADTPLLRIGKAPKALLCYRVDAPMKKMATPALFLPDGTKLQVEAMGTGQQIVGFGLHPDTGAHYAWPKSDPTCIPLADLPTVSETELRSFLAAAEAVLRAAGGLTKKEREAAEAGPQPSRTNGELHTASSGNGFFREVNRRALADIGAWIQEVFPKARQEAGTKAWRVSSVDLGRSLQEDISVHPDGARDFGTEESRTPTHLVMEWTGAATARDAAFYLCDQLGITPAECGWQNAGIGSAEVQERKLLDTGPIAGQVVSEREVELAKLATLDRITYDEQREEAAKRLGCRVSTLDDEVKARRVPEGAKGRSVSLPAVEPWPSPIEGAELLDGLAVVIRRHVVLSPEAADAIALWIIHTWVADQFQHTPRLSITSPVKRCGKSTLLDVLRVTCHRPLKADNISASGVFRIVEALAPLTLLLDEADSFFSENDELRGVLNSGFERTGAVIRTVEVGGQHEPVKFRTFAPLALAGIGTLAATLEDRAIPVVLQRKGAAEITTKLRAPGARAALAALARKAARWAVDRGPALCSDPAIPDAMGDREGDIVVPLLAIADDAGGPWPIRARMALLNVFSRREAEGGNTETGALLLADLRDMFRDRGATRLASASIVAALGAMEERPWPEWKQGKPITPTQLARAIAPFGVRPQTLRDGHDLFKGYTKDAFTDAWGRYLPTGDTSPTSVGNVDP